MDMRQVKDRMERAYVLIDGGNKDVGDAMLRSVYDQIIRENFPEPVKLEFERPHRCRKDF